MPDGVARDASFSERGGWWVVALRQRFPDYAAYEQRVRRFIPRIY